MHREYKLFTVDEVGERLRRIPGLPEEAIRPISVIAFETLPMPPALRDLIGKRLKTLQARRIWVQMSGAPPETVDLIDGAAVRLRRMLRPDLRLTLDRDGKATGHFISFADRGDTPKHSVALGAFIVMAMDVLQAKGLVLNHTAAEEQKAAQEEKELPPTAPEIVSVILDSLGWESNRTTRSDLDETDEASRTPESILKMYGTYQREFGRKPFALHVHDGKQPAHLPSADEIEYVVGLAYPGSHGIPESQWTFGPLPRVWLPVDQAA